jgi:hypothetical protein
MKHLLILGFMLLLSKSNHAQTDTAAGLGSIFRTSDLPREIATQGNRRKASGYNVPNNLPEGSVRVGCICMNNAVRPTVGTGSCVGRGGVRFWLVKTPDGDTLQQPTARHERSPDYDPEKFVGPNPQGQPTIIVIQNPAPSTQVAAEADPQAAPIVQVMPALPVQSFQAAPTTAPLDPTLNAVALWLTPVMNFGMVLVICLTIIYILRLILAEPTNGETGGDRVQVFKRIRLTLVKIFVKNNRFFK